MTYTDGHNQDEAERMASEGPAHKGDGMTFKILEVRDEGTHIDVLAIRMLAEDPIQDYYVHARGGYPRDGSSIMLMRLSDGKATNDPYDWPLITGDLRTLSVAHRFILKHFDALTTGDVVDVEFILGERPSAKTSERLPVGEEAAQ